MTKEQRKGNPKNWSMPNEWRWECQQMRLGVGQLSVPWPVFFLALGLVFSMKVAYVIGAVIALDIIERFTGVSIKDTVRFLRSNRSFWLTPKVMAYYFKQRRKPEGEEADNPDFVNQLGMLHAQPKWKKRSRFMSIAFSACLLTVFAVPNANAQMRLILPKAEEQKVEVQSNLQQLPMISKQVRINGYGLDVPFDQAMSQIAPKTWAVRFRDAELKSMKVDWRSQNRSIIELMHDLAQRYNVLFRFSNRTGVIFIEWAKQDCRSSMDKANVYQIIC